jgi:hypothetical protein
VRCVAGRVVYTEELDLVKLGNIREKGYAQREKEREERERERETDTELAIP